MREKCDEFGEHVMRFVEEGPDREMIRAILVTVSEEYVRIAVMAVSSLAKYVLSVFALSCCGAVVVFCNVMSGLLL